ncbi:unnamed protein product [Bodo saltans]|uniref:SAM domain-containing protein n=1 Tax=Bodo saltans TaxID=75058 RepID=A0A0S4JUF3_BODSA|nr:unnamed protein product [Bodo saltans]|eukprot:CUG94212.1 unnamed protein product [Bodo saltans]
MSSQRPGGATEPFGDKDSVAWLHSIGMDQYAGVFSKYGFESTFTVGLLESPDVLIKCGIFPDDATFLFERTQSCRLLLQRWSPMIVRIPTTTTVARFLQCTPVPVLSVRALQLAEHGFDTLAALKNFVLEDGEVVGLSIGHAQALHHIALLMNDPSQMPKSIAISLELWLANISPPMHHYMELLRLVRPDVETVEDLLTVTRSEVMSMLISIGHRRTLWSYILRARTYWFDSL